MSYGLDQDYVWDGEPDLEPDSPPYVVTVTAAQIVKGILKEGSASMGGCYPEQDLELDFDLGGYMMQMLGQAYKALKLEIEADTNAPAFKIPYAGR